ncbi:MAG: hypothetical protein ACE5FW_00955, partial [Candidatus Aenigmatarchaeota archaeon]
LKDHFIVISRGKGPTYVAPHAAIAFHKPASNQDEGTHHVAYRLVQDGGRAIVSSVTRERDIGIDFFREPPPKELALENYKLFKEHRRKETRAFRKRYAWVARSPQEHSRKARIFRSFWGEVAKSRGPIVFLHSQYLNPIRHPSLIDIIPFNKQTRVRALVKAMNKEHSGLFKELLPLYKAAFEHKTRTIRFKKIFSLETGEHVFEGLEPKIERRIARFNQKLKAMPYLELTFMRNFQGRPVRDMVARDLLGLGVPVLHIEISEFLAKQYPEIAAYLVKDLVGRVCR